MATVRSWPPMNVNGIMYDILLTGRPMTKFEEVQMKIANLLKSFLEVYNIQYLSSILTHQREQISLTCPEWKNPIGFSRGFSHL